MPGQNVIADPFSFRDAEPRRTTWRTAAAAIAITLLAGSTITVTIKHRRVLDIVAAQSARGAVSAEGYKLEALDLSSAIKCKGKGRGFLFTATRDGHLYAGGGCVRAFHPSQSVVVTLPPLR